jgi:hypothetical protein
VLAAFAFAALAALWFGRLGRAAWPMAQALGWSAAALAVLAAAIRLKAARPALAAALMAGFTAVDLRWNNGPNGASALPASEIDMLQPATANATVAKLKSLVAATRSPTRRDRVELIGLGFHWPNASMTHGLEQTLGYNPVRSKLYVAATGAGDSSGSPGQRKFTALLPSYNSRMSNLLGLRYIATGVPIEQIDKTLRLEDLPLIARTPDGYIYENPDAFPRVWFASRSVAGDFERMIAAGAWPAGDPRTTVVLEAASRPSGATAAGGGDARLVAYRNTSVQVAASSAGGGWVVLNDLWHPWWFAEVDGKPAAIERANVLFRAVAVPPGAHTVTFTFRPFRGAWREWWTRGPRM